jgi:hypothetical protein
VSDRQERNKQTALDFYDLTFNDCRPADAIEKDVGDTYIQHNPEVADGKQASRRSSITSSGRPRTTPGSGSSSSGRLPTVTM